MGILQKRNIIECNIIGVGMTCEVGGMGYRLEVLPSVNFCLTATVLVINCNLGCYTDE